MTNFNAIYSAVLNKVAREAKETGSNKVFDLVEQQITNSPELRKQYIIFDTLKSKHGLNEDQAQNFIMFVEKYCGKLDYTKLVEANIKLAKFFNIQTNNLEESTLDKAVDNLIRFNTGGTFLLSEGTQYRKDLLESMMKEAECECGDPDCECAEKKDEKLFEAVSPKFALDAMTEAVANTFDQLSLHEQAMVQIVHTKNTARLQTQLGIISEMAKAVKEEGKAKMIQACVKELAEEVKSGNLLETTTKVFDLKESTEKVLNEVYGDAYTEKLGDLNWIKNVAFGTFADKKNPNQVVVRATMDVHPHAATHQDYQRAAKDIDRRLGRIARNLVNKTIFKGGDESEYWADYFTGTKIWDPKTRVTNNKPGDPVPVELEWWIETAKDERGNTRKDITAYKEPVIKIMQTLDDSIAEWIPEVDPATQQEYLSYLQQQSSDDVEIPGGGSGEAEPSAADIADIEKEYGIGTDVK